MSEKKSNDGNYIVLQHLEETGTWSSLGTFQAHRPEEALKAACATNGVTGVFVVVASRAWRAFEATPLTTVQVKAVE